MANLTLSVKQILAVIAKLALRILNPATSHKRALIFVVYPLSAPSYVR